MSKTKMKLKFKHQAFQIEAAKAVCDVFDGQPYQSLNRYLIDQGKVENKQVEADLEVSGFQNHRVLLTDEQIKKNINSLQVRNLIKPSDKLEGRDFLHIPYNLTVEMETGVGKTYTYIKTMFELNKRYGWSKFIVIVPSIAIREGVYKSFEITKEHFVEEYGKIIKVFVYNSSDLNPIEHFASDSNINVMIINSQAFNSISTTEKAMLEYEQAVKNGEKAKRVPKETRKIFMKLDDFRSRRPIDVIAKTNPILIIDEPQSVLGNATRASLKRFNPLMTIGYSATHKEKFNMIYKLDAIDAYNMKLVKKIEVKGIEEKGQTGIDGYLYLSSINLSKKDYPTATLEFNCKSTNGICQKVHTVTKNTNIYEISGGLNEYKGYIISNIDGRDGINCVEFSNGKIIKVGEVCGKTNENEIRRIQIRETIETHLERERELFYKGIKVLSLFFIDEVANYRQYDEQGNPQKGIFAQYFEEEYNNAVYKFMGQLGDDDYIKYLKGINTIDTHNGYFSVDKKGKMINSTLARGETSSNDVSAYDLIMKNKEELLNLENPVRFIFSHSALKEGWDNPNVFQICALKKSDYNNSTNRRRQEIGRGLRLAVNQNGDRMDESILSTDIHKTNILTVIASESYSDFASGLQSDIANDIDRPTCIDENFFKNKFIQDARGNNTVISQDLAKKLNFAMIKNEYVDEAGSLTDKYFEDKKNDNIKLPSEVEEYKESIIKIIDRVYDSKKDMFENARAKSIDIKLNKNNIDKKEFQELWNRINIKSFYTVEYDTNELVNKAVSALNSNLYIPEAFVEITTGEMKSIGSQEDLFSGNAMRKKTSETKRVSISALNSETTFDIIGKLVNETGLTRKTLVEILTKIQKAVFDQVRNNPEEFIVKTAKIINDELATLVIEHITYTKIEGEEGIYDQSIFTEPSLRGKYGFNIEALKNIYDHVIADSNTEVEFAKELEAAEDVVVYMKIPNGFYISTPVGKYNPDWAIAFNKGNIKHIYFIAETKGSMQTLQVTPIAQAKKHCAIEHFKAISGNNVKYDIVSNYSELMTKVMGE